MHPFFTEHLVRDHLATLEREARQNRLALIASGAGAARRKAPAMTWFMPHVQEGGRLRRALARLQGAHGIQVAREPGQVPPAAGSEAPTRAAS